MDPIRRYPTVAFFTLAYAIAWIAWGSTRRSAARRRD